MTDQTVVYMGINSHVAAVYEVEAWRFDRPLERKSRSELGQVLWTNFFHDLNCQRHVGIHAYHCRLGIPELIEKIRIVRDRKIKMLPEKMHTMTVENVMTYSA